MAFKRVNKLKVLENGFFGEMAKIKLRYMLERFRLNQQETLLKGPQRLYAQHVYKREDIVRIFQLEI